MKVRNTLSLKESGILSIAFIFILSLSINNAIFGQNSIADVSVPNDQSQIVLSKVTTGSTVILNKTIFVGGFDTTYSITGTAMNIKDSKDIIISSIIEDFTKSPTVGYVMVSKSMSNSSDSQELANPFASSEQIELRIQELVDNSVIDAINSKFDMVSLSCHFGNSLDLFSCLTNPLVE